MFQFQNIFRLPRYYLLRIRRLKGDPVYLARGFAFGVFMGIVPLMPIQTIILVPLTILLRVSTIAAIIAGVIVSNPLTFMPQYYLTWKLGNAVLPVQVSWEHLESVLQAVQAILNSQEIGMLESIILALVEFSHLGIQTIAVLLTGGVIIGLPAGLISYFPALKFFRTVKRRRLKKQKLDYKK